MPKDKLYHYPRREWLLPYFFSIAFTVMEAIASFLAANAVLKGPASAWDCVPIMLASFIGPISLAIIFFYFLPVSASTDGLTLWAFNHPWRKIAWSDIQRVRQFRRTNMGTSKSEMNFTVYAPGRRISFTGGLIQVNELIDTINSEIRARQIPTFAVDRLNNIDGSVPAISRVTVKVLGQYPEPDPDVS